MGVKNLSQFLNAHCSEVIKRLNIYQLKNKRIVIDTNMYLYQFLKASTILEGLYDMINILLYFQIEPVFIFDGKPPKEKKMVLDINRQKKKKAEALYKTSMNSTHAEKERMRKKFVRLTTKDINEAKELMDAYGLQYFVADGEAEQLCAKLVKMNYAYACLSEDTDLFLYECPRVLKNFDTNKCTIEIHCLQDFYKKLKITKDEFKEICVLSGTDYNFELTKYVNIHYIYKIFTNYKLENYVGNFINYLINNKTRFNLDVYLKMCYDKFDKVLMMFTTNETDITRIVKSKQNDMLINKERVMNIMRRDNFIFLR